MKTMKIILFGLQGVGKGTYGAMISEKYNLPLLGAGDMLRGAMKQGTEVGKIAEKYINEGNLVPPEVIAKVVGERIKQDDCKDGFILDGFPRNLEQDELLDVITDADFVFEFYAPKELLLKRLTGRRICKECGAVYNIFPELDPNPKEEGKCDKCGGELYHRKDDYEEAIKKRMGWSEKETGPVLEKHKDKVIRVESKGKPEEIVAEVIEIIEKKENQ
jgi:adenylate kinase